jgi:hypothetical protein
MAILRARDADGNYYTITAVKGDTGPQGPQGEKGDKGDTPDLSPYLTQSDASSTYLTQSSASGTYLTQSSASSTYLKLSGGTCTGVVKATSFQATSDARVKADILPFTASVESLGTYTYKLRCNGQHYVGLLAQEVEPVIPFAVSEDDDGIKKLDYNAVVAVLVSEVNSLRKRIKELEELCNQR